MSRLTGVSARFGSAPVVLLLAASLGITALVTYEAQDAAREQKALAWRAIRAETAAAAERYRAAALLAQARGDAEPFASAWRSTPLLRVPAGGESGPALASQPNDSLLSVRVRMGRAEIFRSSPGYESEFRGAAGAGAGAGADGFAVEATLRQGVAERLLAGRLPTCRLGLLLPLLGANALLLGIAVQHYRRERERAQRRSEFVSGVSHELRTPLAQIRMFAETMLLDRMDRPDDRRRALGIITKETARLTGLIENILHFSRAERQAVAVRPEWTRVGAFVEEVVDGYRPLA
ncbi:MAG TPA: histidine kinase dimerization/phospho-acceptor domain-containing protein, partial [Gemmatimonadales bacterium]|nr:histidine kinase dimerization/phospho-acceptor domain-containing protein [Gemmatimonadales bacterium]